MLQPNKSETRTEKVSVPIHFMLALLSIFAALFLRILSSALPAVMRKAEKDSVQKTTQRKNQIMLINAEGSEGTCAKYGTA